MKVASLWKPGHIIKRDTEYGTYWEVNSPMNTRAELLVQTAVLKRKPSNLDLLWNQSTRPMSRPTT